MLNDIQQKETHRLYNGDALSVLKSMDDSSVNCIVTSPPLLLDNSYHKNLIREFKRVIVLGSPIWMNFNEFHPQQVDGRKFEELLEAIIISSCQEGDTVLDPFCGYGATGIIAVKLRRRFIGIDIDKNMIDKAQENLSRLCYV